jgi:membrane-associated phospholipid phosphatase
VNLYKQRTTITSCHSLDTLGRYQCIIILFLSLLLSLPLSVQAQFIEPKSEAVETSGDIILMALPASAALTTVIVKDRKGLWQFTKSFATNLVITGGLKYTIDKRRPFNSGGQAFPSGHTSITFQAASFVHKRYGFKYSIPAYALAGWTGYSRIYATRHDGWDVLAGAVVGIGSSFIFTTPYQQENMQLTFSSSDDQYLLGFTYRF